MKRSEIGYGSLHETRDQTSHPEAGAAEPLAAQPAKGLKRLGNDVCRGGASMGRGTGNG